MKATPQQDNPELKEILFPVPNSTREFPLLAEDPNKVYLWVGPRHRLSRNDVFILMEHLHKWLVFGELMEIRK